MNSGDRSDYQTTLVTGRAGQFLEKVLTFLKRGFSEEISSIIIFGSHVTKHNQKISDLDLIIVMKDTVSSKTLRKIDGNLRWLENLTGMRDLPRGLGRILRTVETKTGMFVCYFLCLRQDFVNWKFAKVFGVNRFLAKLLAPEDLVRVGIQTNATTIAGEDLLTQISCRRLRSTQLVKSCIMNLLQAMGSLLIGPVSSRATIYSMEAVKWSLFSSYAYATGKGAPIKELLAFFRKNLEFNSFLSSQLNHFVQLREAFRPSPRFSLKTPLIVFLIHKKAIHIQKSRR